MHPVIIFTVFWRQFLWCSTDVSTGANLHEQKEAKKQILLGVLKAGMEGTFALTPYHKNSRLITFKPQITVFKKLTSSSIQAAPSAQFQWSAVCLREWDNQGKYRAGLPNATSSFLFFFYKYNSCHLIGCRSILKCTKQTQRYKVKCCCICKISPPDLNFVTRFSILSFP